MNDLMNEQTLRTAFAQLRAAERARICPQGPEAAYRTVRRRRRAAIASAAAGVTALVAVGTGYLVDPGPPAPVPAADRGIAATEPPSAPPAVPRDRTLERITLNALGSLPSGTLSVLVANNVRPLQRDKPLGMIAKSGRFELKIACGGAGTATATVRTNQGTTTATAQCATTAEGVAAGVGESAVTVTDPGTAQISVTVDAQLNDRSLTLIALVPAP